MCQTSARAQPGSRDAEEELKCYRISASGLLPTEGSQPSPSWLGGSPKGALALWKSLQKPLFPALGRV